MPASSLLCLTLLCFFATHTCLYDPRPARFAIFICTLFTWQDASAFNQPLSLDTSSVTDVRSMFHVSLRACPASHLQLGPPLHVALHTSPL